MPAYFRPDLARAVRFNEEFATEARADLLSYCEPRTSNPEPGTPNPEPNFEQEPRSENPEA